VDLRAVGDRRDLYNGFGDSLARAFETVFTPMVFGAFGWWIDGKTGTRPLFALVLFVLVFVYTMWKLARGYSEAMRAEERKIFDPKERRT
jgi:F0F1-type ATP synthase assembly protein I